MDIKQIITYELTLIKATPIHHYYISSMHNGEIYNQKSMNQSRFSYAIAELRGNIYVAGGKGDHDSNLSSVERYDVLKNDWFMVCRMTYPRHNFTLVATVMTGRYLYAVGCERVIERYDPDQDLWTVVCLMIFYHMSSVSENTPNDPLIV